MSSPHDTITDMKNQLHRFKVSTVILAVLLTFACGQIARDTYLMNIMEDDIKTIMILHNEKNHDLNECHRLLGKSP